MSPAGELTPAQDCAHLLGLVASRRTGALHPEPTDSLVNINQSTTQPTPHALPAPRRPRTYPNAQNPTTRAMRPSGASSSTFVPDPRGEPSAELARQSTSAMPWH